MYYNVLGMVFIFFLFSGMLVFLKLGHWLAVWQKSKGFKKDTSEFRIAEGAIFGLLGLLVAFTFNSSATKFDTRRELIIQESNTISTAYLRLSLLPESKNQVLKKLFKDYLNSRLQTYKFLPDIAAALNEVVHTRQIQKEIWDLATTNCSQELSPASCMLLLPALNEMFDIQNTRVGIVQIHPPLYVFLLLVFVMFLSALLAGYSISNDKLLTSLHILSYTIIISITVYIIIDMEYPRLGLIQISEFDNILENVRNGFQ